MSHVFGRDEAEGLRHFEVRKSLKCPHCDVTAMGSCCSCCVSTAAVASDSALCWGRAAAHHVTCACVKDCGCGLEPPLVMFSAALVTATQELYECLATQLRDGKPGHCCGTYYVKANRFFHVPPSTEVSSMLSARVCVCVTRREGCGASGCLA